MIREGYGPRRSEWILEGGKDRDRNREWKIEEMSTLANSVLVFASNLLAGMDVVCLDEGVAQGVMTVRDMKLFLDTDMGDSNLSDNVDEKDSSKSERFFYFDIFLRLHQHRSTQILVEPQSNPLHT